MSLMLNLHWVQKSPLKTLSAMFANRRYHDMHLGSDLNDIKAKAGQDGQLWICGN